MTSTTTTSTTSNFTVTGLVNQEYWYTNCFYMHPEDMKDLNIAENDFVWVGKLVVGRCRGGERGSVHKKKKKKTYNISIFFFIKKKKCNVNVFSKGDAKKTGEDKLDRKALGTTALQRMAIHQNLSSLVHVEKCTSSNPQRPVAHTMTVVVDTLLKVETRVEAEKIETHILTKLKDEIFCKDQRFIVSWPQQGTTYWLSLRIVNLYTPKDPTSHETEEKALSAKVRLANMQSVQYATIDDDTVINLMTANNPNLVLVQAGPIRAFGPDWDPESLGIGGLDMQFGTIFRRAFASRLYPPDIVKQLGVKHVKGMLLYGPPGTGKTLIARSIGKMLTEREPKVVNGPEVLNKFVGQSEENIRELFRDAQEDQQKNGDKAGLHIIIFDEIDAICKQRGSTNTGTGVHDTVVNQLLSMIDGVNSLNNILVIGMTNRKDLIDEALLRSGRLEVHIEIGLPDERGREQIFRIHTRLLRENGFLADDISLSEYAARTKNYSGAEIEAVVRSAVSYAMQEHIDVENLQKIDLKKMRNIKISKEYFELALQEVQPEFGVNDDDLQINFSRGIILFNDDVEEIIDLSRKIVTRLVRSNVMNRQSLLLQGDLACGKSALACFLAKEANFPFVRVIRADDYVGAADGTVCARIAKIFDDAYKSDASVVIIDDLERLIGYTVGVRFSNPVLQTILTSIRRNPSELNRKIFVIATCTYEAIRTLQIDKVFDWVRDIPLVHSRKETETVMEQSAYGKKCKPSIKDVCDKFPEKSSGIGISALLAMIELAVDNEGFITPENFELAIEAKARNLQKNTDFDFDNLITEEKKD
ncbi:N-ethylmaleimide-sensitive fusion protein [Reticulomyxa filosa]|uniref:Vesicle-fusing ATPase n=1 Tax=Reticulomyxa filosa TaxID=46433 RepID=X6MYI6_RETFI|nr:N-ethylmaleimide-sensitive fusion protein [Reticulomyxa filosa]|eukprot:ETO19100.1 N-ethylmaleimide-sensitive fusion protein [Reticulomyxa filosa]